MSGLLLKGKCVSFGMTEGPNNSKKQIQLNLCIQVNIVLQNSHFDCGDITTAQNIKNSPLESASEMSDEENIFNT